jgi:hypothetical protein
MVRCPGLLWPELSRGGCAVAARVKMETTRGVAVLMVLSAEFRCWMVWWRPQEAWRNSSKG